MNRRQSHTTNVKYMLAGGSLVAALGLLTDARSLLPAPAPNRDVCQEIVRSQVVLSREQLSQLLTIPERSPKDQIRQVMPAPYCKLKPLSLRTNTPAYREAYPLAFDPQTWFVVLYEGDEYAGYSFSFRH